MAYGMLVWIAAVVAQGQEPAPKAGCCTAVAKPRHR